MSNKNKIPKKFKKVTTYKSPILKEKDKQESLAKTAAKIVNMEKKIAQRRLDRMDRTFAHKKDG